MDNIFVTVGIPLFNAEKFIKQAIESVLRQTYSNFELIITDDGSSDKSLEIIKAFSDPRIMFIPSSENKGLPFRLNQQVNLAKGKYFVRMDQDDLMFPDRIKTQVEFLEANSNIDLVGSSCVIIDDNNEIIGYRKENQLQNIDETLEKISMNHPTVCGKTSWFKENRYNPEMHGAEDFELWHRTFLQSNFHNLSKPLLFYRDPLVFKLKTYLFRQEKLRKVFESSIYLKDKDKLKKNLIFKSKLKVLAARIFSALKMDNLLIKNRNQQAEEFIDVAAMNNLLQSFK